MLPTWLTRWLSRRADPTVAVTEWAETWGAQTDPRVRRTIVLAFVLHDAGLGL